MKRSRTAVYARRVLVADSSLFSMDVMARSFRPRGGLSNTRPLSTLLSATSRCHKNNCWNNSSSSLECQSYFTGRISVLHFTRRCFSSNNSSKTSTSANNKSKNQKRRRPKSSALVEPQTTRDRIRWLQDHNESLQADNHYRRLAINRRMEDLGDVAEERLHWMRNKIFGFWRGNDSTTTNDSAANTQKTKRVGPKMDAKWWFWNICFSLLPAVCIAAYCELIGKPQMLEHQRFLHIHAQKKKWGDAYDERQDEELARLTLESEPFATKLYQAIYDLSMYFFLGQQQHEQQPTQPQVSHEILPPTASTTTTATTTTKEDVEIAELKQRLEELEKRLRGDGETGTITSNTSRIHSRVVAQQQKREQDRHQPQGQEAPTDAPTTIAGGMEKIQAQNDNGSSHNNNEDMSTWDTMVDKALHFWCTSMKGLLSSSPSSDEKHNNRPQDNSSSSVEPKHDIAPAAATTATKEPKPSNMPTSEPKKTDQAVNDASGAARGAESNSPKEAAAAATKDNFDELDPSETKSKSSRIIQWILRRS